MKAPGRRIAATVTRGAVGCSAWLGVAGLVIGNCAILKADFVTPDALQNTADNNRSALRCGVQSVDVFWAGVAKSVCVVGGN